MGGIPEPLTLIIFVAAAVVGLACVALIVASPFLLFKFFADVRAIRVALERLAVAGEAEQLPAAWRPLGD